MGETNLVDSADESQLAGFGEAFLSRYLAWGFQSLSKKDIELLIYFTLEDRGLLDRYAGNYAISRQLHVTQERIAKLRREAYARWATDEQRRVLLERSLVDYFTEDNIRSVLASVRDDHLKDGFLPILLEHPVERVEFEQALKEQRAIPRHARNREVLLVRFDQLLGVLERHGITKVNKGLIARLQRELAKNTTAKQFLKKDLSKLTLAEARGALNDVVASAVAKLAEDSPASIAKLLAPLFGALVG
jgi:hypothetical protein